MDDNSLHYLVEKIRIQAQITDLQELFPHKELGWIRDSQLLSMPICGQTMGLRKNSSQLIDVLKLMGGASLPVGRIYEGHVNALQLINVYADQEQKNTLFSDIINRQLLLGVWNTQQADGVVIRQIEEGKYRLEGCKTFCSGGHWIQLPMITGQLISKQTNGWQMCIIPLEKVKRISVDSSGWKPLGMRASASYKMDFTGIVIDKNDLIGQVSDYYRQPYFSAGALRFAAVQLGAVQMILQETHRFLKDSGRADDTFQKIRIAEMATLVETGNLWVSRATVLTDLWQGASRHTESLLAYVNMTRSVIAETCIRCMDLAERSVGISALMQPHPLERIHRDLTTYLKQPAPDAAVLSTGTYVLNQQDVNSMWADSDCSIRPC